MRKVKEMNEKIVKKIKRILADSPELLIAKVSGPVYFESLPEDEIAEYATIKSQSGEMIYLIPTVRDYQEYVLQITEELPDWFEDIGNA